MIEFLSNPILGGLGLIVVIPLTVAFSALCVMWAIEQIIRLLRFTKALTHAYGQYLSEKKKEAINEKG